MTSVQWRADAAARAEQHPLQQEAARALRRSRIPDHDPQRSADRLALIEAESCLAIDEHELARNRSGDAFPRMDEKRRAGEIAERASSVQMRLAQVDDLRPRVGDPEMVVDAAGYLPRDRRELALISFAAWRSAEVRVLTDELTELRRQRDASEPRSETRSRLGAHLSQVERRLATLCKVPEQTPEQMCGECIYPFRWHRWSTSGADLVEVGPCAAWPRWGARLRKAREML